MIGELFHLVPGSRPVLPPEDDLAVVGAGGKDGPESRMSPRHLMILEVEWASIRFRDDNDKIHQYNVPIFYFYTTNALA